MSGLSAVQEARARREAREARIETAGSLTTLAPPGTVKAESQTDAEAHPGTITVQLFGNLYDNKGTGTFSGTDREVLAHLGQMHPLTVKPNDEPKFAKTKAQAPMFNVAIYPGDTPLGANRADVSCQEGYWGVVGDADAMTPEDIEKFDALLMDKRWLHLKTTSFKHTKTGPRVRYVLPVNTPVNADGYVRAWDGLNALAGGKLDAGAKDPTRRSYLPSCPRGEESTRPPAVVAGARRVTLRDLATGATPREDQDVPAPAAGGRYDLSLNADVLTEYDNTPSDFELIRTGCAAVGWAADSINQPSVQEPYWRALLGIVRSCAGAEGLAHDVSKHHPDYDHHSTSRKLSAWNAGPTTCAEFENHTTACAGCKHRGKVKSPIVLGRVNTHESQSSSAPSLASVVAAGGLHPIVDQDGVLNYVETYQKDGRTCRQVLKAGTGAATDLILTTAAASGGRPPSQQTIALFEAQLRTRAKRSGDVTKVAIRVAQAGDTRFVDLGPGRIVRITPEGWTQVDESADVPLFRRGAGAGELPDPIPFEGNARAAFAHVVRHYREMFQTPPNQIVLRTGVVLDRLDPETPHPTGEYVGHAGSGKSTGAEHDNGIIDPPSKAGLRSCGFKTEDIAAAAQQQYVLTMDNVSRLDKSTSDTLCMCSTGGTWAVRKLYEQAETAALHLLRPVSITAVSPVCTQPDLQNRTLRFEFRASQTGDVISEHEIRAATAARLPALLGALYTLKAATLRVMPEVRLRKGWKHRLITFDQTGEAMLTVAGYQPGKFLEIVGNLRESMARRSASGDVFLLKVCAALKIVQSWSKDDVEPSLNQLVNRPRRGAVFETSGCTGALMRPGVLLGLLPRPADWDRDSPIPKTERPLLDALRRVQPTLQAMGVLYRECSHGSRIVLRFDWRPSDLDDVGGV